SYGVGRMDPYLVVDGGVDAVDVVDDGSWTTSSARLARLARFAGLAKVELPRRWGWRGRQGSLVGWLAGWAPRGCRRGRPGRKCLLWDPWPSPETLWYPGASRRGG